MRIWVVGKLTLKLETFYSGIIFALLAISTETFRMSKYALLENQYKSAGEEGAVIYLWSMIKESKAEFIMEGVVSGFLDHGIEVLLHAVGQTVQ